MTTTPDPEWSAISQSELEAIIRSEEALLDADRRAMWERYRVPLAPASILRSKDWGVEQVFVVARNGTIVLYYDDVEDECAVGKLDSEDTLTLVGYVGELRYAIAAIKDGDV